MSVVNRDEHISRIIERNFPEVWWKVTILKTGENWAIVTMSVLGIRFDYACWICLAWDFIRRYTCVFAMIVIAILYHSTKSHWWRTHEPPGTSCLQSVSWLHGAASDRCSVVSYCLNSMLCSAEMKMMHGTVSHFILSNALYNFIQRLLEALFASPSRLLSSWLWNRLLRHSVPWFRRIVTASHR